MRFDQVPHISVEIEKHGHPAIAFIPGFVSDEFDTFCFVRFIVPPKIVREQKQKYPSTGLATYAGDLFVANCFGEQQSGFG